MPLFLDPERPLSTCRESGCKNCDAGKIINCHFNLGQLLKFMAVALPSFIVAGIGLYRFSPWSLLIWLVCVVAYFLFIEIRVMCSHCPHYAEPGLTSLKCWANYGAPKLWKYRPGPMSRLEKIVFISGMAVVFLLPLVLIILSMNFLLLAVYVVLVSAGFYALLRYLCGKCMNFACPFNRVGPQTREKFFEHNPSVREAWKR